MSTGETFPAGSVTVRGHKEDIWTDDSGTWIAYPGHERVEAPTKDKLKVALSRHFKALDLKVEIPFVSYGWRNPVRKGVATALHSRNHSVMVTWEDGSKEQLSSYGGNKTLKGDVDPAEWQALMDAHAAAEKALRDFEEVNKIDLAEAVRTATNAAVDAAGD